MKKISCIIPAYNEEKGIGLTIESVIPLIGKELLEVIVIDDASKDKTKEIIKNFPSVRLIEHETNKGKSRSVVDGIKASQGDYVLLLDADLKFLDTKNILDLIEPVENDKAEVSISYIKNAWPLFPFKTIDYLSGQRVISKQTLMPTIEDMAKLNSYGLEVFINRIIINKHMSISIVQWPNVENDFNQYKHGWFEGIKIIFKVWMNVISTVGVIEMYTQNIKMLRLLVK